MQSINKQTDYDKGINYSSGVERKAKAIYEKKFKLSGE